VSTSLLSRVDDPTPLYFQFQRSLRERIQRREWAPGQRIPSEPELAREYGISRTTIREGLDVLEKEGVVERRHGHGTFVRDMRIVSEWNSYTGFMPALQALGHSVTVKPLAVQLRPADTELARWLQLEEGALVTQIRRLVLADGEPFLLSTATLSERRFPGLAEVDFSRDWLVETLERRYSVRAARQERWLEPVIPKPRELRHLGLTSPAACLLVDERNLAADGTPISFIRIVARGDRCRAYFQLETR